MNMTRIILPFRNFFAFYCNLDPDFYSSDEQRMQETRIKKIKYTVGFKLKFSPTKRKPGRKIKDNTDHIY